MLNPIRIKGIHHFGHTKAGYPLLSRDEAGNCVSYPIYLVLVETDDGRTVGTLVDRVFGEGKPPHWDFLCPCCTDEATRLHLIEKLRKAVDEKLITVGFYFGTTQWLEKTYGRRFDHLLPTPDYSEYWRKVESMLDAFLKELSLGSGAG